ncbi:hypothetical protein [Actinomyces succiniciruminis]|nr:hypothetical protein [Actinomyces succiniciruminis]
MKQNDQQGVNVMTNESSGTGNNERGPFGRPGFIAAALVVALIAVLGIVVGVTNVLRDDPAPESASTASTTSAPASSAAQISTPSNVDSVSTSVCGLTGEVTEQARLAKAPDVDYWDYQGTVAYPVSEQYGPGATADSGYRYCFQRSPEGAVFAAAHALAAASDPETSAAWAYYALSQGEFHDQLMAEVDTPSDSTGVRLEITGFRLLAYDGRSARVDLSASGSAQGSIITASIIYSLIWEDGDWKIDASVSAPFDFATIPDASGYIAWGA